MCSTGPFQFRWLKDIHSSCYYHHQIGSINHTHSYHICRGCLPEMFVTSYSVTYCIHIPGRPGFCFHYYRAVYDECKYLDTFWLADRVLLFVHYTISSSSLCKLIWRHWTYKMPVKYILSSVWVRLSIFSQLSILQYMGLCVFTLPIPLVMSERIYNLSYHHHQIGSMIYYPLFGVRSWNNGMRCMFLYILLKHLRFYLIVSLNKCVMQTFTCTSFIHSLIMMTSSNGNIFRVTGPLCGEFTGPGEFPTQRPVTRSFDVFFDLRLNKRWIKQPWGWWYETPS